ncbi:MAG: hypothetical protein UZ08_BCD001001973 [Candidatus Parvibacillus calidus]|nr:MAG: hypothetical protein UZ08_BCD001001973 [Candidatus Parvibacillus calidus]
MKILVILFSIYFLALSIMPCEDIHHSESHSDELTEISCCTHNDQDHSDFCSPFCNCCCCGTLTAFKTSEYIYPTFFFETHFSKYFIVRDITFVSSFNANIWQPPRIG